MSGTNPAEESPVHESRVRVRYAETDTGGVVYHSHYLVYFEVARTELMRKLGVPYRRLEEEDGLMLAVVHTELHYRGPAHYDDELAVLVTLSRVSGARVTFGYEIRRVGEGTVLCAGSTVLGCLDRATGRPRRLPPRLLTLVSTE